jgi:hypothetical protein
MNLPILRCLSVVGLMCLTTSVSAENHVVRPEGGVVGYGSQDCNADAEQLTARGIVCTAVFADTKVWDLLDTLPRRITLAELNAFNPDLGTLTFDNVIGGITFVRVQ